MGGVDKGLQVWRGRPLAAWVLDALRPQVESLAINANRHAERYALLGVPVFGDADPDAFAGPMAGLLAGLQQTRQLGLEWTWTAACDAPLLPSGLGAALWAARNDAPAVLPRTADGQLQPAHALVHVDLFEQIQASVAKQAPLGDFLLAAGARELAWPGLLPNLNTPEQLHAAT